MLSTYLKAIESPSYYVDSETAPTVRSALCVEFLSEFEQFSDWRFVLDDLGLRHPVRGHSSIRAMMPKAGVVLSVL